MGGFGFRRDGSTGTNTKPLLAVAAEEKKMGMCGKLFIFLLFTQVVQALMSYDGGATQFCTTSLVRSGWSPFLLGLLGAMDKFGQVATAFVWGEVLKWHDAKLLLFVGLFWKAACCLLFGWLQRLPLDGYVQVSMLASKLGMGVTEALVSVWATVWVQRNAPQNARARWLGFAGTSAGIGNGVGSGVASLWNPGGAFVLQAIVLFAIWVVLIFTPAWMFRFGDSSEEPEPEEGESAGTVSFQHDGEHTSSITSSFGRRNSFPQQMLAQEVASRTISGPMPPQQSHLRPRAVYIESIRCAGQFLDSSVDEWEKGFRVRLTKGDPMEPWAQFKMRRITGNVVSFESVRLPGHFLDASGSSSGVTSCLPNSRVKVGILEKDGSGNTSHFRLHRQQDGIALLESVAFPGHYLDATGDRESLLPSMRSSSSTKVSVSKQDLSGTWAQFRLHEVNGVSTQDDPCCSPTARPKSAGVWQSFLAVVQHRVWLFTAMSISISCFVTSGISFLWQNTINSVWGFDNGWSFGLFAFSTGAGGLIGVAVGPDIFDRQLGGFDNISGKARCLLRCKHMMLVAALCSTVCTLLLAEKACHLVATNSQSVVYWQLAVLCVSVFSIFVLIYSIMGTLYGINTDAVNSEMRTFAAGLTVSFQSVFGFAFGPLLPSAAAELIGEVLPSVWPGVLWDKQAVNGAKFAVGMGVALAATWVLFVFTRLSAVSARLMDISSRRLLEI